MPKLLLAIALVVGTAAVARAQTGTQDLNSEVQAINRISLSGSPSLVISTAAAGSAPTSATANATYAITTNETDRKITAQLDVDAPAGVAISVSLAAPSGGTSAGAVQLSTTAQDVVTGISTVNASGLNVTYSLTATAAAGVVPAFTRTVTYTITGGA